MVLFFLVVFAGMFIRHMMKRVKAAVPFIPPAVEISVNPTITGLPTTISVRGGPVAPDKRWLAVAVDPGFLSIPGNFPLDSVAGLVAPGLFVIPMTQAAWTLFTGPKWEAFPPLYMRAIVQDSSIAAGGVVSNIVTVNWTPPPSLAFSVPGFGGDLSSGIPLTFNEGAGTFRKGEPVTFGVPIAAAEGLTDLSTLELVDAMGTPLPASFQPTTRWGRLSDTSAPVQWLHVQTHLSLTPDETSFLALRRQMTAIEDGGLLDERVALTQIGTDVVVDTGTARFEIDLAAFDLFDAVYLDRDGSGTYDGGERVFSGSPSPAVRLTDPLGVEYATRHAAAAMDIEVHSPGFTRLAIHSEHRSASGGIGRDYLRTTTRLTFVHGSSDVRVAHTIRNDYLDDPLGAVALGDYTLSAGVDPTALVGALVGGESQAAVLPSAHVEILTAPGTGLSIYQDSSGGPNWSKQSSDPTKHLGVAFQGFQRSRLTPGGSQTVIDTGLQVQGVAAVSLPNASLIVAMRHFWQKFPQGMTVHADGSIEVSIFPHQWGGVHWMDDLARRTTYLLLSYGLQPVFGTNGQAAWQGHEAPLVPVLDPAYISATRSWGDTGDLPMPPDDPSTLAATAASVRASVLKDRDNLDSWGWTVFGETWGSLNTHTTGSPRNKLSHFDTWLQTGQREFWDTAEEFALHSQDVRPYHAEGFFAADRPNAYLYEGPPYNLPQGNLSSAGDDIGRAATLVNVDDAYRAGIPLNWTGFPKSHGNMNGFDYQHHTADDIFEYWLLRGDPLSLEALEHMGQAILSYKKVKNVTGAASAAWASNPFSYEQGATQYDLVGVRGVGWTLRSMARVWRTTSDEDLLVGMGALVDNLDNNRGPYAVTGLAADGWLVDQQATNKQQFDLDGDGIQETKLDYESPWQMGPGLMGLASYRSVLASIGASTIQVDSIMQAGAEYLADAAWQDSLQNPASAYSGMFPKAVHVTTKGTYASDPSLYHLTLNNQTDPTSGTAWGTVVALSRWTVSGLAAATQITGDPKYLDPGVALLNQTIEKGDFTVADKDWHWWIVWLEEAKKHGLVDAAGFPTQGQ